MCHPSRSFSDRLSCGRCEEVGDIAVSSTTRSGRICKLHNCVGGIVKKESILRSENFHCCRNSCEMQQAITGDYSLKVPGIDRVIPNRLTCHIRHFPFRFVKDNFWRTRVPLVRSGAGVNMNVSLAFADHCHLQADAADSNDCAYSQFLTNSLRHRGVV